MEDLLTLGVPEETRALLLRMPKAELHLHLDGSIRPATALELAQERGLDEGLDLLGMRDRLTAPPQSPDQAELLRAFDLPIAILQDGEALERTTAELVEDVSTDGTRYAEIRWAPALHTARGLSPADVIRAVLRGAQRGAAGFTSPATPSPIVRFICVAMRTHDPDTNRRVASTAGDFLGQGLTGFDLAGPEAAAPDPLAHHEAFEVARSYGLGITVHAGEWGTADQVRRALEVRPGRIAHGALAAIDPALVRELAQRQITLDLCPTSNVQAGLFPDVAHHPLAHLFRSGVPVTLSTDDRTVSAVTLELEYARVHAALGLTIAELWRINRHALEVAFLDHDEATRDALRREFDEFAASEPALSATPRR